MIRLLTEIQFFDERTILLNVLCFEVIEKAPSLTYEIQQRCLRSEIFSVFLEVACQVVDPVREKRDLPFCATCVCVSSTVLFENAFLNF